MFQTPLGIIWFMNKTNYMVGKDDEDNKEQEEEIFFAKIPKMTKYTSLPNLVKLGTVLQTVTLASKSDPMLTFGIRLVFGGAHAKIIVLQ